jgi:hypothetical protein
MKAKYKLESSLEGAKTLRLRRCELRLVLRETGRVLATARIFGPLLRRFDRRLDRAAYLLELAADRLLAAEERLNG